jgi:hypothetical protein
MRDDLVGVDFLRHALFPSSPQPPSPSRGEGGGTFARCVVFRRCNGLNALTPCPPLLSGRGGTQPHACAVLMRKSEIAAHIFCPPMNPHGEKG